MQHPLDLWHDLVTRRDADALDAILADEVVFHSPVVHTPQRGKPITKLYLSAALHVLNNDSFLYLRKIVGESDAARRWRLFTERLVSGRARERCGCSIAPPDEQILVERSSSHLTRCAALRRAE